MTVGIYKLVFEGTDKIYIGQSINIEKRFLEHLRNLRSNKASRKLQLAYNSFGTPKLECIIDCSAEELDELETLAIKLHDSFNNGFNSLESAGEVPKSDNIGDKHGRSRYSNEQVIQVFKLLVYNTELTANQISNITNVSKDTIKRVSSLVGHLWLEKLYPEDYAKLRALLGNRNKGGTSAIARGISYLPILSPLGVKYMVENASAFAEQHNLHKSALNRVLNGKIPSHKGWKLACQKDNQ